MNQKILSISAKWLFILCLPILLLTASIGWTVNISWLYEYGFNKYNVGQTTELADSELKSVATGLISYFNSDEEYIAISVIKGSESFELFSEKEIIHLRDVKRLIRLDYWVLLGTSLYALAYAGASLFWRRRRYWRQLAWAVACGSGLTLALMLTLGLGTLFDFDQLFLQFHLLSFANELWMLDPTKDYLIMLFPRGFFYDTALCWALATAVKGIALGIMSGIYWKSTKRQVPE